MATNITLGAMDVNPQKTFLAVDAGQISIGGQTLTQLGITITDGDTSVTVPGVGVFTKDVVNEVIFTAAAGAVGSFTMTNSSKAVTFTKADFGAATNASLATTTVGSDAGTTLVTIVGGGSNDVLVGTNTTNFDGGAGNDAITTTAVGATVVGGTGNDTITANDTATITGGEGADKFVQKAAKAFDVKDYTYAQGDTITIKANFASDDLLSTGGKFTDAGASVAATVVSSDNVYKVKATDGADATKEFWTAQTGTSAVTMDASAVTAGGGVQIDVTAATNAVVKGSAQADVFNLAGSKVTLQAGSAGGTDQVNGFNDGFSGDVLNLTDASATSVKWGAAAAGASIGATVLKGIGAALNGKILVKDTSDTVKKVSYATAKDATLGGWDADVYMGFKAGTAADTNTVLDASAATVEGTVINLTDTTKYKYISNVKGASNATATYVGAKNAVDATMGTHFDLQASFKASQVWGGSNAADTIDLKADNGVADTVWFGFGDGADSATGFEAGFGATADVLNLHNVSNVADLTFAANAGGVDVSTSATNNKINLQGTDVGTGTAQLKLQTSAGDVKKVAVGYTALQAATTINGVGADLVIGQKDANGAAQDTVQYDAKQTTDAIVNLQDATIYKNIKNVKMDLATGSNNAVVGSTKGGTLTLATISGAVNDAWGGSSNADHFVLNTGGSHQSKNTIWFGTIDGADDVDVFDFAKDKIRFHDRTVSQLANGYTYDGAGVFKSKLNALNTLTLTGKGAGTASIIDSTGAEVKAVLGAAGAGLNYVQDSKLYMGDGTATAVLNVSGNNNVVFDLANGKSATVNDIYFSGVTAIDATNVTAQTVLIGAGTASSTLKGGTGANYIWGGGAAADVMQGGIGADQFWFSAGDGADKVTAGVDKKDTIVLYGTTSISDVTVAVNAATNKFVVTAKDGSTLTVDDVTNGTAFAALDGGLTFQFGINESAKNYTYNRVSNSFVAK